uniref:HORMA domain-containing protein n=1 Tax=Ascaris lumbricoides TaxID=6252 RepID=A0A0M3HYZ2_ASCLU
MLTVEEEEFREEAVYTLQGLTKTATNIRILMFAFFRMNKYFRTFLNEICCNDYAVNPHFPSTIIKFRLDSVRCFSAIIC